LVDVGRERFRREEKMKHRFIIIVVCIQLFMLACFLSIKEPKSFTQEDDWGNEADLLSLDKYVQTFPYAYYMPALMFDVWGEEAEKPQFPEFQRAKGQWQLITPVASKKDGHLVERGDGIYKWHLGGADTNNLLRFDMGNGISGDMTIGNVDDLREVLVRYFQCSGLSCHLVKMEKFCIGSQLEMMRLVELSKGNNKIRITEERFYFRNRRAPFGEASYGCFTLLFPEDTSVQIIHQHMEQHYPEYLAVCQKIQTYQESEIERKLRQPPK